MCVGEWEHPVIKSQEALDLEQASYVKMVLMIFKIPLLMRGINLCNRDLIQDPWI
jgi:hypothetical protein